MAVPKIELRMVVVKALVIALVIAHFYRGGSEVRAATISASSAVKFGLLDVELTIGAGGQRLPLPLARDVNGAVQGHATVYVQGVPVATTPGGPGSGAIATVGPPPAGGSIGNPVATATKSNFFGSGTATTQAQMSGFLTGPGGGVINAVSINGTTSATASATFGFGAGATAVAETDPIVLAPLSQSTSALLTVDLLSNYPSDPTASFQLQASSSDNAKLSSNTSFSLSALTNIPGLSKLFALDFSTVSAADTVTVHFFSPVISQPIFASDFTTPQPGVYVLDPSKRSFSIPFNIPARTLGSDSSGSYGLSLDMVEGASANVSSPEPSTLTLLSIGAITLLGYSWRRRKRMAT
jgi:hypothetical protein